MTAPHLNLVSKAPALRHEQLERRVDLWRFGGHAVFEEGHSSRTRAVFVRAEDAALFMWAEEVVKQAQVLLGRLPEELWSKPHRDLAEALRKARGA